MKFTLDPKSKSPTDTHAFASRCALETYARVIGEINRDREREIMDWVEEERRLVPE